MKLSSLLLVCAANPQEVRIVSFGFTAILQIACWVGAIFFSLQAILRELKK